MYRKINSKQMSFENFLLPFGGKLRSDNRWVILSKQIPWEEVEAEYIPHFSEEDMGSPAKSSRIAFGALILKERLGVTDRELTEQIAENPFLQYFLGLSGYQEEAPFHHSLLTHFRKRFSQESLKKINEAIARRVLEVSQKSEEDVGEGDKDPGPKGKLIVDATCTPADIKYPTDLNLLSEAREKTEAIIDHLHPFRSKREKKPRNYRQKARKDYLGIAKMKKAGRKKIRQGVGKQLRYLRRNLAFISEMAKEGLLVHLSRTQYRNLLVIHELFRQQQWMHENRSHRIANRIVSITQPHIRPIIRGKAGSDVEFGAKVSVSLVNGMTFVDRISWDAYNESGDLVDQIESYRKRFGHDPASVHADKIYRTRENIRYCKSRGIRLSGPPLGRPKKVTEQNAQQLKKEKHVRRRDEIDRIAIEGKFGQGKRRFGLARIMAKLAKTSEAMIMISFMVMNLEILFSRAVSFLSYFCWKAFVMPLMVILAIQEQAEATILSNSHS